MKIKTLVKYLLQNTHPEDEWDASLDVVEKHLYRPKHKSGPTVAWNRVMTQPKTQAKRKT